MIVTAALCWWNELPEDLDRCIRAAARIADRVVALDGAYRRYPTGTPRSSEDQCDAIRSAAASVGMECRILQPDTLWAGQVEKRSFLLAMASVNSDWIATLDADHVIHANREECRRFLSKTSDDVVAVPYVTPANPDRPIEESAAGVWHVEQTEMQVPIPHLWRVLPGMRVEKRHWWYSGIKNGNRQWLWGGDATYPPEIRHGLMPHPYYVEHRCLYRTPEQVRISRSFLNDRERIVEKTGQEDDIPGLWVPEYDDVRMPA